MRGRRPVALGLWVAAASIASYDVVLARARPDLFPPPLTNVIDIAPMMRDTPQLSG